MENRYPRGLLSQHSPKDELTADKAQTEACVPGVGSSWRPVGGAMAQGPEILGHRCERNTKGLKEKGGV